MQAFLQQIANHIPINEADPRALKDHCYVFPNRRAGVYFKKYLTERFKGKFIWSPQVLSIVEFVELMSDKVILGPITLAFELFSVYFLHEPEVQFDKFYPWGQILLRDFDEIDKYMADAEKLFQVVKEQKEIETDFMPPERIEAIKQFWNIFEHEKDDTELKDEFIKIWQVLGQVYKGFRDNLQRNDSAYYGMAIREIAENLEKGSLKLPFKKIVFGGFNALATAEIRIIEHLTQHHDTTVYWDTDAYYMTNRKQEAGNFVAKYYEKWKDHPKHHWAFQTDFAKNKKNIHIIGVPLKVGQAKYTGQLLQNALKNKTIDPTQTAVVLGDESLLFPMLYALPDNLETVNVTMGYPLKNSPLLALLENIYRLQKSMLITPAKDGEPEKYSFYSKSILEIINNAHIKPFDAELVQSYSSYIARFNIVYTNQDSILKKLKGEKEKPHPVFVLLFQRADTFVGLLHCFNRLLVWLFNQIKEDNKEETDLNQKADEQPEEGIEVSKSAIELEFIYHLIKQLKMLEETLKKYQRIVSLDTFWKLFREIIVSVKLPFTGEPLRGVQVMGFLETRTIDYQNLFVLSVNEGVIPATKPHVTYIPFNLRKGFGLPTFLDQDAIYAYHFYHMLQRSEKVFLLYNTEVGSFAAGEKSRFLLQLEHELKLRYSPITITNQLVTTPLEAETPNTELMTIPKNADIMERLSRYFVQDPEPEPEKNEDGTPKKSHKRQLSATALTTYVRCPVQFYFQYIAELRELGTVDEEINDLLFGNVLHYAIELIYRPYMLKGDVMTEEIMESLKKKHKLINKRVNEAFKKILKDEQVTKKEEGFNLLMKKVIKKLIYKIIETDAKQVPFKIIELEEVYDEKTGQKKDDLPETAPGRYDTHIDIGEGRKVRIKGIIDRIDEVRDENGAPIIRILDYKTGKVQFETSATALKLPPDKYIEKYFEKPDLRSGFQIYYYAYLYWLQHPTAHIQVGIYALQEISKGVRFLQNGKILDSEFFLAFETRLKKMLTELFDEHTSFLQSEDEKAYAFSAYRGLVE